MELIVAEKPSVARDIARVVGATGRGEGCLKGPSHVVTWCIGHLVELEEPAAYNPSWKSWRLDALPMLPETFQLRPSKGTTDQWRIVRNLLRSKEFDGVINACDAGREGELIFRFCYELAGCRLPSRRLWVSSMTDQALRAGLASLRPSSQLDALAAAARCRAEADWLVGMNATRAVTTRFRGASQALFSIGRVQTPTLALVVEREKAILAFVPKDYFEILGTFSTPEGSFTARWNYLGQARLASLDLAKQLLARLRGHDGKPTGPRVESLEETIEREAPPLLFDLTSLQRTANKRFGLSAQKTLDIAQALYETHKLITYPRTDSRHLSNDIHKELPHIFQALAKAPVYAPFTSYLQGHMPGPIPRVFSDGKVTDHHAIIPTAKAQMGKLEPDEARVYDLIVRRFLGAFFPDARFALTTAIVLVGEAAPPPPMPDPVPPRDVALDALPAAPDRLRARGRVRLEAGWQDVAGFGEKEASGGKDKEEEDESQPIPRIKPNDRLGGVYAQQAKRTRPPPRYTEATLLSAMEFAGREMDDEALRHALRDRGLGTPATRASTIETLLRRGYVERRQKNVVPTPLGTGLIDTLPIQSLASAELTGEWEARLARMARSQESREAFMKDINDYVRSVIDQTRQSTKPAALAAADTPSIGACPLCQGRVIEQFKSFSCESCAFRIWKVIAGKKISDRLAGLLLRKRRSEILGGFQSKAGKRFEAALELDATGTIRLSFANSPPPGQPPRSPAPDEDARENAPPSGPAAAPPPAARKPAARKPAARKSPASAAKSAVAPGDAPPPSAPPPARAAASAPAPAAATTEPADPPLLEPLRCPHCGEGDIIPGKRAWGCSRWREGCKLVIPFAMGDKKLTPTQLRELITKGHTRKAGWVVDGQPVKARLLLDLGTEPPKVSLEA